MGSFRISSAGQVRRFFAALGKHVITFAGFGELGYGDRPMLRRVARDVLRAWDPADIVANTGTLLRAGGEQGIAEIYSIAAELGIDTSGIHPSLALDYRDTHRVSPHCRHVHFVRDRSWGGFLGGRRTSPTLRITLAVTDELVVIGGGKHAADELQAFLQHGKRVRFYPAEMNRRSADEWCQRSGNEKLDYRGAAHLAWLASRENPPPADE